MDLLRIKKMLPGNRLAELKGRDLDAIALNIGLKRKTSLWFFKERDSSLRSRITSVLKRVK